MGLESEIFFLVISITMIGNLMLFTNITEMAAIQVKKDRPQHRSFWNPSSKCYFIQSWMFSHLHCQLLLIECSQDR